MENPIAVTQATKLASRFKVAAVLFAAMLVIALSAALAPSQALADDLQASSIATQTTKTSPYTLGKTVSGTVGSSDYHYYTFALASPADISYRFSATSYSTVYWSLSGLSNSTYEYGYAYTGYPSTGKIYLPAGAYRLSVSSSSYYYSSASYNFVLNKVAQSINLSSKKGKIKSTTDDIEVPFTFSGSNEYLNNNLSLKVKNTKVATATTSLGSGGAGTLTIKPLALGKTTVSLKLAGAKTAKYTVYVTKANVYVAKGKSTKLAKPIGAKSAKFKMKKSSKAKLNKKTGKIKSKKAGRVTVTAKKGGVKYSYNVIMVDYVKLARDAYKFLEEYVPNPDKMKIHNAYKGYNKTIMASQKKLPVAYIDYSYMNENGGYQRNKIIAYYDDALDMKYISADTSNDVMKKKAFSKKELKKVTK